MAYNRLLLPVGSRTRLFRRGGGEPKPEGGGSPPEAGQREAPAVPQEEKGIPAPEQRGSGRRSPSPPDAVAQLL